LYSRIKTSSRKEDMGKPKRITAREIEGIPKCLRSGETNLLHIITNKAKEHGKK